jgi:hypothetical protein
MTVWIYVDTAKQVGDPDHLKVFASQEAAEGWFAENDPGTAESRPAASGRAGAARGASDHLRRNGAAASPDRGDAMTGKPELYLPTDVTTEQLFRAIGKLRKDARNEIDRLIRFLDETENHMELEPEEDGEGEDAEPSLGSFDRMTDQSKAWRTQSLWAFPEVDAEQDDCDSEDADPNEAKLQPLEMTPCA